MEVGDVAKRSTERGREASPRLWEWSGCSGLIHFTSCLLLRSNNTMFGAGSVARLHFSFREKETIASKTGAEGALSDRTPEETQVRNLIRARSKWEFEACPKRLCSHFRAFCSESSHSWV